MRGSETMRPHAPGTQVHADLDLHEQLQARGVTTIVLPGLPTSEVVLSTVRDAGDRDYRVLVLRDASDDPDPEVHAFLLERIPPAQAEVLETADLDARLG